MARYLVGTGSNCWNFTDAVWDDNGTIKNRKGILFDSAYA